MSIRRHGTLPKVFGRSVQVASFGPPVPPAPPARLPQVGDELEVWITERVESDDHWSTPIHVYEIRGGYMHCGSGPESVRIAVKIASDGWRWPVLETPPDPSYN